MDMVEVKSAITDLGKAVDELRKNQERELAELKTKGFVTAETLEKHEKINAAIDAAEAAKTSAEGLKGRIDGIETAMSRASGGAVKGALSQDEVAYKTGLNRYMRKGSEEGLRELEQKTMQVGVLSDGGYAVTRDREAGVVGWMTETVGMRQAARVVQTSQNVYEVLRRNGLAAAGGWVSETGARAATANPTFALARLEPGEMYANVPVTQRMLDDAAIDVEGEVMMDAQTSFATLENSAFTSGTGVGRPRGILTYANGTADQQIEQTVSGNATDLTAAGLITLQQSLFEVFQPGAKWMFRRATLGRIRRFTEAVNGQFLWQPGLAAGVPPTLLGKPYVIASDMPAIGSGSLSVAYGDFMQGYRIVDRIGIRVLRDPFTSKPNVLFYVTKLVAGDVVQFQAIKLQVTSA